ncbi:hypothetical protein Gotur_031091 [Gossypium turneri]
MLFVSLTPEVTIAGALLSAFYPLLNLFSGFLIPQRVGKYYYRVFATMETNPKVVDVVVLSNAYIMDIELLAHFTIWRYK